jgi:anti-anti-sigma factor
VLTPVGATPGDHLAWAVDGPDSLDAALVPFLDEGAVRGERLLCIAADTEDSVASALATLPALERLMDREQLLIRAAGAAYEPLLSGDVWSQVDLFQDEARQAVADGFAGIRVWADVTPLAADQDTLAHFLDYETAIEKTFREGPATGLCALDVTRAGDRWGRLSTRHRVRRNWGEAPNLAVELCDNVVEVVGEVDISSVAELQDNLESVQRITTGPVVIDLAQLDFLDVAGTRAVVRFIQHMAAIGRAVRLVGARGVAARVLELFDFTR